MDLARDFPVRKALILLGALIVAGGFAVSLLSGGAFGSFGFSPSSSPGAYFPQDVVIGPQNSAAAAGGYTGSVPYGSAQVPGTTHVVGTTTFSSTTSVVGQAPTAPQPGASNSSAAVGTQSSFLEFSSNVFLQAASPQTAASGVVALAYSYGGYVAYQSTYVDSAFVVVRVPASQYQKALAGVEALGMVTGLVSNSNDVMVQYTDLNATLASLRTEQGALLRLLNQSSTISSTLAIESQLQEVDRQINEVESQILQTRTLIAYATVSVTISSNPKSAPLSVLLKAAPQNGTAPFSVTFNAIVKGGAQPYFVNFNFGDGTADQGLVLIHTYVQSGDFKVTVTATDQNGTVATATATVRVDAPPTRVGVNDFFGTIANLFVSVVEGIVEVAVVVLPLAAVGFAVAIPLRRRSRIQKEVRQAQA